MEINTAGALSLYTYQTALQSAQAGGASQSVAQGAAAYQALTSAFSAITQSSSGDPLVDAAGAGSLGSLVTGIYSSAAAAGNATPIANLSSSLAVAVGGSSAATASGLLSGLGSDGLEGVGADALDLNSTLAMAAYSATLNGLPSGTLTDLAKKAAAATEPSSVQDALQAALAGSFTNTLNLLA